MDGGQHKEQREYDEARTHWLESQGYRVVRFWDGEVSREVEAVKEATLKRLEEA